MKEGLLVPLLVTLIIVGTITFVIVFAIKERQDSIERILREDERKKQERERNELFEEIMKELHLENIDTV